VPTSSGALAAGGETTADQAGLAAAYGQLPLSFEANQGQTEASVDFLAHGQGYTLLLSAGEARLSLRPPAPASATRDLATADQASRVLR
jgi:hypothetical protein